MMNHLLLVGLGGCIGSIARYLCQLWIPSSYPQHFPWATFTVNVTGCLLIGIFWGLHFRSFAVNENWKLFLMTGLCGGFTTFSAFTLEGILLLRSNRPSLFFLYAGSSVILGLLATYAGVRLTR